MKYIEYTPRKLSALIGLTAAFFTVNYSPARAAWPPLINANQAAALTQAQAAVECGWILQFAHGRYTCTLFDLDWVEEKCKVKNPRLPYRFFLGSWATCPLRYWVRERFGDWSQTLHGCVFGVDRKPPRFRLKARGCVRGTRFPSR